ncbi:MAG: hypothetical protein NTY77_15295 [Elusimicrobia bacterium]|nr:hypothetical protein [Elusimicrobiota bacterium]
MKVAILLNRSHSLLRAVGKRILTTAFQAASLKSLKRFVLPEYYSFAGLLDPAPLILGTGDPIDWAALKDRELLIWEWGWTATPARTMLEIKNRTGIAALMFPGPLDRFWRELKPEDLELQFEAAQACEAIGAMLEDTVSFYKTLVPTAHVFHLPVPIDTEALRDFAAPTAQRDRKRILLTAPTRFTGPASQLPIATFVAFRRILRLKPALEGLCFVYDDEEKEGAQRALRALGLSGKVEVKPYLRPIQRYLQTVAPCWAGLSLPHGLLQGRTAMTSACIGIPMVLSEEIETHRRLYPKTCVRWHDTEAAANLCLRLLEDDTFRKDVVKEAAHGIEYYSVENCRRRLEAGAKTALQRRSGRPA